jgi:hypothetical protein
MRAHVWHTKSPSQRTCQIGSGTTRSPASHEEVRAAQVFSLGDKIVVNSPPTEREEQGVPEFEKGAGVAGLIAKKHKNSVLEVFLEEKLTAHHTNVGASPVFFPRCSCCATWCPRAWPDIFFLHSGHESWPLWGRIGPLASNSLNSAYARPAAERRLRNTPH